MIARHHFGIEDVLVTVSEDWTKLTKDTQHAFPSPFMSGLFMCMLLLPKVLDA
jgi:hypothetical protein